MTPKERAVMQQALEALEVSTDWDMSATGKQLQSMKAITALREALAEQAEQEPLDDNARDNMLLWMIQRHFPSLPLSDEHTDWGRWLGFANAAFEAGRKDAAPVRTKDLTVSELDAIIEKYYDDEIDLKAMILDVIAADREKNK